ncbi:MAG: response regulator [Alphaproteobacteria bacterium]|nr:response regulator [Alphaproteobacteria bacterium]
MAVAFPLDKPEPDWRQLSVLAIDGDLRFRAWAQQVLLHKGVNNYYSVSTGIEAIDRMQRTQIDLCLVDILIDSANAGALIRQLRDPHRSSSRDLRIILVSKSGEKNLPRDACQAGVESLLRKPISQAEFLKRVIATLWAPRRIVWIDSYIGRDRRRGAAKRTGRAIVPVPAAMPRFTLDASAWAPPAPRSATDTLRDAARLAPAAGARPNSPVGEKAHGAPESEASVAAVRAAVVRQTARSAPAAVVEPSVADILSRLRTERETIQAANTVEKPVAPQTASERAMTEDDEFYASLAPPPAKAAGDLPEEEEEIDLAAARADPTFAPPVQADRAGAESDDPDDSETLDDEDDDEEVEDEDEADGLVALETEDAGADINADSDLTVNVERVLDQHQTWLATRGSEGARAFLMGEDLSGRDFSNVDLVSADLRDSNLTDAVLHDTNLEAADLRGATLTGVRGKGANFNVAKLRSVDFYKSNLRGATMCGADLSGANLFQAELAGADLSRVQGLIQRQLTSATGDRHTNLPAGMRPVKTRPGQ